MIQPQPGGGLAAPGELPRSRPAGYITLIGQSKISYFFALIGFSPYRLYLCKAKEKGFLLKRMFCSFFLRVLSIRFLLLCVLPDLKLSNRFFSLFYTVSILFPM